MDSLAAVAVALLTALLQCGVSHSQTGIERVPAANGSLCSDMLTYICVTSGLGEAVFNVAECVLSIRNSQYIAGTVNETVKNCSDYSFTASNLQRSESNDSCYDMENEMPGYCFTTELTIPVIESIRCHNVTCGTLGNRETTYGADMIERKPESPYNLKAVNKSIYGFTATWMPLNTDCPSARFEVTTMNCGSCNSTTIMTTTNDIRCNNLTAVCRVSVRSVSECGSYSESVEITVEPPEVTMPSIPVDNDTVIAAAVGTVVGVAIIVLVTSVIIAFLVYRHRKRFTPKSNASSNQRIVQEAETPLTNVPGPQSNTGVQHETPVQAPQEAESSLNNVPGSQAPRENETSSSTGVQYETPVQAPHEAESSLNDTNHQPPLEDQNSLNNASPLRLTDTSHDPLIPHSDDDNETTAASSPEATTPQNGTEDEIEFQSIVLAENVDVQPSSSHCISTTDIESTSLEPTSTDTQQSVGIQSEEEVNQTPGIQAPIASEAGQSLMLQKQLLPSTRISDFGMNYEIIGSQLGRGGFGVVFRVKYMLDETEYALKVIPLPNEPSKQEKVLREVKALARLTHSHIVRYSHSWKETAPDNWHCKRGWEDMQSRFISFLERKSTSTSATPAPVTASGVGNSDSVVTFRQSSTTTKTREASIPDASLIDGTKSPQSISVTHGSSESGSTQSNRQALINMLHESPPTCLFIRMELCQEDTLKDWLSKNNKENTRLKKDVLNYFEQMLRALEYIHRRDYIHRDLKPSNIFFSREDNQLKIGDFGLVTTGITDDSTDKRSHYEAGTTIYASPEQLNGHGICSTKSDIYTLGLICFELHFICSTSAEKTKVFEDLRRKGKFPSEFPNHTYKEVSNIITSMMVGQSMRPSAREILDGKDFKELTSKVNEATKQPHIPYY